MNPEIPIYMSYLFTPLGITILIVGFVVLLILADMSEQGAKKYCKYCNVLFDKHKDHPNMKVCPICKRVKIDDDNNCDFNPLTYT